MKNTLFKPIFVIGFSSGSDTTIAYLKRHNWQVMTCIVDGQEKNSLAFQTGCIGLVDFREVKLQQQYIEQLRVLIEASQIKWLALIQPEQLEQPNIKELLAGYFDDYHLFPIGNFELSEMLKQSMMSSPKFRHEDNLIFDRVILGHSKLIRNLKQTVKKISSVNSPVLITGETGTGKELVARALHKMSGLSGPFIAVNCGGIASTLIQAELFGYEKGAFTGANQRKKGYIEAANNGTLFLDEIGELAMEQQANLLRFLQEGTIQRVGSVETTKVNVRVIAATNVDIEKAVEACRFRADLFYRLNVLGIKTPPLREREQDIELLAYYFLNKFTAEYQRKIDGFTPQCLEQMKRYAWHGNIREMMNQIKRAVIMSDESLITEKDLDIPIDHPPPANHKLKAIKENAEKEAIISALENLDHNISDTALYLGISRAMLYRLIEKHGLRQSNNFELHQNQALHP